MTQEDKELLLKDLCGRLPYGTIVQISLYRNDEKRSDIELDPHVTENIWEIIDKYHAFPYLRPLSSMTEEEYNSVNWNECQHTIFYDKNGFHFKSIKTFTLEVFDWLNKNHFDYFMDDNNETLIDKGLAIDCTGLNIY